MRTEYPASYGRIHPGTVKHDLSGAILSLYAEMGDLQEMQRELMRDAADGTTRASMEITAEDVEFLSPAGTGAVNAQADERAGFVPVDDEPLPF